jgi:diguanylate cyclase (GGDEF)-like protein/PAS domain S-box-containing protein
VTAARIPANDTERLRSLAELGVLDSAPEREFDALVQAAALVCGVPIALIGLVDADRVWFKANLGMPGVTENPRELAFCAYAILDDGIFEVPDATLDPRFVDSPLVTGEPNIRFYAGASLCLSDGHHAGTLCVIDRQPRKLDALQREVLGHLAAAVVHALEGRRALLAERELREIALQAEAVLRNSVDAIVILSLDGKVRHWNEAAQRLFGYSPAEILGQPAAKLVPLHRRDEHEDFETQLKGSLAGLNYESVRMHRNGEAIVVSVSVTPIRDAKGQVTGATKIIRDIREQARAASVLAESEARFKALSEVSPLGVFATDTHGACTYTNGRWQCIYGLTFAQSLGNCWAATVHPDDRAAVLAEWQRTAALGVEFEMEFRILRTAGETRTVRSRARANPAADGSVMGYVGSVEDVTEQRATTALLAASEQRLRGLYESTPAMLHSIDPQGRLLTVTGHWLDTLGYTREEVIGRPSSDFLTAASQAQAKVNLPRFFAEGRCDNLAYQMVCKNGGVIDVLLSAVLERDASDQPLRSMAVVRNVTEQLRAERALSNERLRLASIIEGTGAGTWEWNVQTGESRLNERWAAIIGHTLDELAPISIQTWLDRAHSDDLQRSGELLNKHFAGELPRYDCEARMGHRDGHWVWVMSRGCVLTRTPDGKPEWMFGTHTDITERKRQGEALRKSEQLLNRTGEVAGVGGWELDLLTGAVWWSAQTRRIHDVAPDYVPVLSEAINFYAPEARPVIQAAVEQAMVTAESWDLELPLVQATGQRIWVRAVGAAELEDGKAVRLVGAFQDVTALRTITAELAEQHELLRVTLQSIGDAVITTDASSTVTWLNPVAERMTGWLNVEAKGRPVGQVFHIVNEETRAPVENPVAACLQQGQLVGLANCTVLISRNGDEFGIEDSASPIRNDRGELLGVVLVFHDVTEQRRLSGEMSHRAMHDALTGLVNRTEFEARLRRVLNKAREDHSEHALLFIDLDQFKLVNDACGHLVGDQLLQQVSKLLGETARARDTLARLGGDEFALILEDCSAAQAQRVAQQVCERMDDFRFMHGDRRFRIGASIGLVPVDKRWGNTAAIMQAADTSCYAAKDAGRNRVHTWFDTDQAMRARHGEMQWAARLEQALDENRFVLYAQRIEALDQQTRGLHAEVLLRMIDSDGSVVQPSAFLPAAERFHFASRIDRWVLRHAIDALRSLANLSTIDTLCINLSGPSIGDRAFHRQAIDTLIEAGAQVCGRLCLEITETAAITQMSDAGVFIDQVRALGVRIALDEFGAGASSFGYLKNLNVDLLKIDGQFIRDLPDDPLDDAAVRCFVDVARVVGVKTVAEFVDRAEVLDRVREIGVDFAQGFLLHRPEPIEAVLGIRSATPPTADAQSA